MSNSDSDSSQDINLESYVRKDNPGKRVYQLQHIPNSDNMFKFTFMGLFETLPVVNLGDFNIEGKYYFLTSHFVFEEELTNNLNNNMIDMLALNINNNGKLSKLVTGIEFNDNIDLDNPNQGAVYLRYIDDNRNEIIKKNLTFPGSTKILYFLVRELKNDKIQSYINE